MRLLDKYIGSFATKLTHFSFELTAIRARLAKNHRQSFVGAPAKIEDNKLIESKYC